MANPLAQHYRKVQGYTQSHLRRRERDDDKVVDMHVFPAYDLQRHPKRSL